jgi:hypothetical protein
VCCFAIMTLQIILFGQIPTFDGRRRPNALHQSATADPALQPVRNMVLSASLVVSVSEARNSCRYFPLMR